MKHADIRQLFPPEVWAHFCDLNAVPRPSKKEERVIRFMQDFGASLGLETYTDEVGNVIIRKPATAGMEDRKTVVLQSHLDMVHQKNNDTVFDFDTQGIEMQIDGDWVKAKGTTLGADNGMGVATIMALLASSHIPHPPLEALFTIDEETGMTGAMGLKGGVLKGEILLNLDTEEDDEIDMGCAGGIDVTVSGTYGLSDEVSGPAYRVTVKGLNGGHSGMDIHKGLGNANKIMNRLLYQLDCEATIGIISIEGGSLRNAIPRESVAIFRSASPKDAVLKQIQNFTEAIRAEFKTMDPGLTIETEEISAPEKNMDAAGQRKLLNAMYAAHNGVYRMSPDMPDLVETSNNVAKVTVANGVITVLCLTRSSVEFSKMDLAQALRANFEQAGYSVEFSGAYPGWAPNVNSEILKIVTRVYREQHGTDAHVVACHAGLECGILGRNYPEMDMISFGPTIRGAHSPDERVNIASVGKFWKLVCRILEEIPRK